MSHEKWLEYRVLIESDWNLKCRGKDAGENASLVLIESDWNLKEPSDQRPPLRKCRINRIRLEFKDFWERNGLYPGNRRINRIRLEFKV